MKDVVISQVDCCIESDLCDTTDRRTNCLGTIENRGNVERYRFHYKTQCIIQFIIERVALHFNSYFRKRGMESYRRNKFMHSEV